MNTTTFDLNGPGLAFITGLGRMFYIINPKNTSFATLEEVPNYIAQAIPFFLLSIALELVTYVVARRGEGLKDGPRWEDKKYRLNDTVSSIGAGMLQQISRFFIYNITLTTYLYVWNNWHIYNLDTTNVSTWIFAFLAVDFSYYWFHRAAHEVNIMWSAHVVHHSSEYYNQSTALRQSVLQSYTSWIFYIPYALVLPPPMFVAHNQFNTLYQYWIHTEVVGSLGFLEYIINTPSAHRVHHGRNPYCIDKNYAGTLIIWDIIFGTFALEKLPPNTLEPSEQEHVAFGLTHPINTFDPITIQTHHLKHIIRTAWSTRGLVNKLKVVFYGPGWHDDTPRTGLLSEIPVVSKELPPPKYDPVVPAWVNPYVFVHFLLLIGATALVLLGDKLMHPTAVHTVCALVLWSLTCFGWLFDRHTHGPWREVMRCAAVIGGIEFLFAQGLSLFKEGVDAHGVEDMLRGIEAVFVVSLAWVAWVVVTQKEMWFEVGTQKAGKKVSFEKKEE